MRALVIDVDGTLVANGEPRVGVVDYVNAFDGAVIVVTARHTSQRADTEAELGALIRWDELVMRGASEAEDVFKARIADALRARFDDVTAIDNDAATRDVYTGAGFATIDPDTLGVPESATERSIGIGRIPVVDSKFEHRYVDVSDIEVRDGKTGDGMSFRGYAAVFNSWSENLGGFRERIAPGAFARSLKSRNEIRMYVNHNADMVLASRRAGTLRLSEDERGLQVDADLPETSYARDLSQLMKSNVVSSMSFGFSVPAKGDTWNEAGTERELRDVRLHEVSVVTGFPAYPQTTAHVRSLDILADKTGLDAVRMNEAITKLEAGEELSADDAALLDEAISKLKAPSETPDEQNAANLLLLKKKQLDLAFLAA